MNFDRQPKAVYIHVPFCAHHCGYCNFSVIAGRDDLIEDYLQAIEIELSWLERPRPVETIFVGGGTPTHLAESQLIRLFDTIGRWFPLESDDNEISVEANPAGFTENKMDLLVGYGVNRLSLGGQSFNADKLQRLERDHCGDDVVCVVEQASKRFSSISLDLIFAAPDETLTEWQEDLELGLQLPIQHISTYGLTYEHGTTFWSRRQKGELSSAEEELEADMYLSAISTIQSRGLVHYEVSNFARPGHECRHNMTYWRGEPYFAAGPGAARYIGGRRETNHRSLRTYLKRVLAGESPTDESEQLSIAGAACERLIFGLRMLAGVELTEFHDSTGFTVDELAGTEVAQFIEQGLLQVEDNHLKLTQAGLLVSDSIWPELLTRL